MSSKRRKLIQSTKPTASDPRTILNDSVHAVLQAHPVAGGSATAAASVTAIDEALAGNSQLNEPYGSYEQVIRRVVNNRMNSDSDFTAERFPNCSKWINKKK